jgi:hypothetical protein
LSTCFYYFSIFVFIPFQDVFIVYYVEQRMKWYRKSYWTDPLENLVRDPRLIAPLEKSLFIFPFYLFTRNDLKLLENQKSVQANKKSATVLVESSIHSAVNCFSL